jgi:hypothetical protein
MSCDLNKTGRKPAPWHTSDHGTFTGSLYAPVNKTYIGIVNGSNDNGTVI